jgi:hypothetical protein
MINSNTEKRFAIGCNVLYSTFFFTVYSSLSIQAINFNKTVAMFSSRAVGKPKFDVTFQL